MPRVPATETSIAEAGRIIRDGGLVAFPTETVYGLGGDATNGEAVAAIFAAKGRPSFNPLIVHVTDLPAAEVLGEFSAEARVLAGAFWPGPMTLVVRRRPGCPIAAPSANRSGHVSPTLARHADDDLGNRVPVILDGGAAVLGLESTVIDVSNGGVSLLRQGAVTAEDIAAILGRPVAQAAAVASAPSSPGQLASHYAPNAVLRLNATEAGDGEALLAFGRAAHSNGFVINLSPAGDLGEAAANLFAALRAFDTAGSRAVAVMPIPETGLGAAINDRLRRAAAPRP